MISNEVPSKEDENQIESDIVNNTDNDLTGSDVDANVMGPPITNVIKRSVKPKKEPANTCEVCGKTFGNNGGLKYHIRRAHFNLVAKIPSHEEKQINQVWFERVLNSDSIVEIKKAGQNVLLLRKLDNNTSVRVQDCNVLVDLTAMYPTGNRATITKCEICNIDLLERDYKKHYDEKHGEVKKHHCNNCNMTFKRSYFFIRHKCNKTGKRRRRNMKCQISKVESLTPIPV